MNFFNPLGFLGLLSLPVTIILYTVKQKSKKQQVSSLYLWEKIRSNKTGSSFFKKLRNNIFLYLDLLIALLVTFALTEAYIHRTHSGENLILVIDSSLSMQAEDTAPNRLDAAKKQALQMIDNRAPEQIVSVIAMNENPQITAAKQTDGSVLKNAVDSVQKTYGGSDGEKTAALIQSLSDENTKVYILSDNGLSLEGDYEFINLAVDNENCAVTNLSQKTNGKGGVSLFALVENQGSAPVEKTISIYADNKIIDSVDVTIQPGAKTQVLADTDFMPAEAIAEVSPKDSLAVDDTRYLAIAGDSIKKVLLVTNGNIFLEKALNAQPDVELYKSDSYSGASGYDCYVFDGVHIDAYPGDGDIIIFDPDEQKLFTTTPEQDITNELKAVNGTYFSDTDIAVKSSKGIESDFLQPVLKDGDRVIMAQGSIETGDVFVCGFDIHNSDLPLKMDFPILIYNILNGFDTTALGAQQFIAGEPAFVTLRADTVNAEIAAPDGTKTEFNGNSFVPEVCGIYTLYENGSETSRLAVNCKITEDSGATVQRAEGQLKVNYKLRKIFLLIALAVLILELIIYLIRTKPDIRVLCLRALIFVLLISSISDLSFASKTKNADTVFILDRSESASGEYDHALQFINTAMRSKGRGDHTALIAFGANAGVDSGLDSEKTSYTSSVVVDTSATDIERAVNTAMGLFTDERGKHIVLLTDGKDTEGNAYAIKNNDAFIDIVDLSTELDKEAQVSRLNIPSKINKNSGYDITVKIDSLTAQQCGVALYKNGAVIYEQDLKLEKGENRFTVHDNAGEESSAVYKCVITPSEDTYEENNVLYSHTYIDDTPTVLLLEQNSSGQSLYDLLQSFGLNVERADISLYVRHPEELSENDLIVMADCPAESMSDEFMDSLKSYVRNSAGGLIVTGAENAFAPGCYKNTVMEEILPVNMDMLDEDDNGTVAFFMVSDRSGSMSSGEYGKTKLQMTKEAMAGAVKNLNDDDTVAVLAFDDYGEWIVEPTKVGGNTDKIIKDISGISVGGGTSILPSLQQAYEEIIKSNAAYKHIILMTDGQAETTGYDDIINNMRANNITLSTIAVGNDADTQLLEGLAQKGGGRYYYTDEFSNLPNIFSKEAKLAGRDYINNGAFYPNVAGDDDILKNVNGIPLLGGYVASSNKTAGKMVLSTDLGEPVLSYWQYGLGKTAAFTTDFRYFGGDWISSADGRTILKNLVSSVMRRHSGIDGKISYSESGNKGYITIDFNDIPQQVSGGSVNNTPLEFTQISIGTYRAEVPKLQQGSYLVNAVITDNEGVEKTVNGGLDIGYSKEFDINSLNNVLKDISADNVTFISQPDQVFGSRQYKVNKSFVFYKLFLPLALILFLAEIFIRRIGKMRLPQIKLQPDAPKPKPDQTEESTAHTLLSNKKRRSG